MQQDKKPVLIRPILGLTMGDPNGIGPEILAKALSSRNWQDCCLPLVIGDKAALENAGRTIRSMPPLYEITDVKEIDLSSPAVPIMNAGAPAPAIQPGVLDPEASRSAAVWIEKAARLAMAGQIHGVVTCPVNKEGLLRSGSKFPGHTPMLQSIAGVEHCHMSLFHERLRIVHISAHLSMAEAVAAVKKDLVLQAIEMGYDTLCRLGFPHPRLVLAGLNPHAGEGGAFGREEIDEIRPAAMEARNRGIDCAGPLAPDTVFNRAYNGEFDLVIAMYHDQGHIPFKLVAMDDGVHVTLGLPFIRTSPDHGTAYDIAGTGRARENSLCAAMNLTAQWAATRMKEK
ncbi:MAG: 4-hydroxythreonine-4-phosphate dehydrogenase PdxA [Candidatus Hydrogenedentes bacterium]|jgi:4-hydroxythreonine-4-phosphate dehydrogenase|nr:4-hydroxythreonine-4-phosphate dehydrogenase PdxA [Candidatus Hydrogenedentota bacterium]